MQTEEFLEEVVRFFDLARTDRTVVMCAKAVPWRCHRSLIADSLVARGCCVLHVIDRGPAEWHRLRKEPAVMVGRVSYPVNPEQQLLDL